MITIGIVDDEPLSRENIRLILENYCPGTKVVGMAGTLKEAQQLVQEQPPQLLFLDIELPDGTGFDLMYYISPHETKVVFASAHADRGLETYEYGALYYMGKPIRISDVQRVVALYQDIVSIVGLIEQFHDEKPGRRDDVLIATETDGYRFVSLEDIVHVRAMRNCCEVHLANQTLQVLTKPIKEMEDLLPSPEFLRTHRSYIVNRRYISKIPKGKRGEIELHDGTEIPMSEDYFEDIRIHLLRQVK